MRYADEEEDDSLSPLKGITAKRCIATGEAKGKEKWKILACIDNDRRCDVWARTNKNEPKGVSKDEKKRDDIRLHMTTVNKHSGQDKPKDKGYLVERFRRWKRTRKREKATTHTHTRKIAFEWSEFYEINKKFTIYHGVARLHRAVCVCVCLPIPGEIPIWSLSTIWLG